MSTLWDYLWPAFAIGLSIGAFAMWRAFRLSRSRRPRKQRQMTLIGGVLGAIFAVAMWHGPLDAADRLRTSAEGIARTTLVYYEMPSITATLEQAPMTRRMILRGEANDFQREELVRIMSGVPGVSSAGWPAPLDPAASGFALPLLLEGILTALLGYALGMGIAYVVELRRRANAEWRW